MKFNKLAFVAPLKLMTANVPPRGEIPNSNKKGKMRLNLLFSSSINKFLTFNWNLLHHLKKWLWNVTMNYNYPTRKKVLNSLKGHRYELEDFIGEGGFAQVYKVSQSLKHLATLSDLNCLNLSRIVSDNLELMHKLQP